MDEFQSLIIGEDVQYSITKEESAIGTVVDKVLMVNKLGDTHVVTGYLIENHKTGKINQIAAWRIQEIIRVQDVNYNKV